LKVAAEGIALGEEVQVILDSQNLHYCQVSANGPTGPSSLNTSEGHWRHSRSFGDLHCGQTPAQPRKAQAFAKAPEELL